MEFMEVMEIDALHTSTVQGYLAHKKVPPPRTLQ